MGEDDVAVLLNPTGVAAFQNFVQREQELLAMLEKRLEAHSTIVKEMTKS